jgi:integrase
LSADSNAVEINREIKVLKDLVLNIYIDAKKQGLKVDTAYIRRELKPKKEEIKEDDNLLSYIKTYLKRANQKAKNNELSKETLKSYNTLKNKIDAFQQYTGVEYKVKDVDLRFYNEFKDYSIDVKKLSVGTFGNDINRLKTAVITAKEEYKIEVSEDIFSKRFKRTRSKTSFITLNEYELKKIIEYDFSLTPYLDNARDWIIIGCNVGQRVEDLLRLTTDNITFRKGREYIELTQEKTTKKITLPVHENVTHTLNKNGGNFPRAIAKANLNKYIKEVGLAVGLKNKVQGCKVNPDTKRKENGVFEKWELIVSHCFRRSFASNHYGKLPTPVIMGLTGHTTEAVFLKYINREETQDADLMADYWDSLPTQKNPNLKIV